MDKEMTAEYNKALKIAKQYRMNTLRIRRLLAQHPMTCDECLVNAYTGKILVDASRNYIDKRLIV